MRASSSKRQISFALASMADFLPRMSFRSFWNLALYSASSVSKRPFCARRFSSLARATMRAGAGGRNARCCGRRSSSCCRSPGCPGSNSSIWLIPL
eukprot:3749392-Pyramimonas_sp.AAC.1